MAAYAGCFSAPFVFDDTRAILENPSIRRLWPPWLALLPPERMTTSGRPLVNLSLALNYAAGKFQVAGYHAVNLAIHLLAGLMLAALVRRTAMRGGLRVFSPAQAGVAAALLWLLHPLQTEAVTYTIQRAESLAALFSLAALYGVAGYLDRPSLRWFFLAVGSCACAMASKESAALLPLVALAYDRTFCSGSFAEAWRRHRGLHIGLAASWALLLALIGAGHGRGGSVGLELTRASWRYALTQGWAILHYLRLSLWPAPLVFDYGEALRPAGSALPFAAAALGLVAAAVVALWRRPVAGFLACSFFALLAPSSSIFPVITEAAAEHRMYLPLAALAVGAVVMLDRLAGLVRGGRSLAVTFVALAAAVLLIATVRRNEDFADPVRLWASSVAAWPRNARAQANLAEALGDAGRYGDAEARCREAARIDPADPRIWFDLGALSMTQGDASAAKSAFEESVRLDPRNAEAQVNLAVTLEQSGFPAEALAHFQAAARVAPDDPRMLDDLGIAFARRGNLAAAVNCFRGAQRLDAADPVASRWLVRLAAR